MASPTDNIDPIFPRALEYKIFREYFDIVNGDVDDVGVVMRTAKRVHEWLLPLIEPHMRITFLPRSRTEECNFKYPGIGNEGIFEASEAIKYLYIGEPKKLSYDTSHLLDILRSCHTNIEGLALWDQQSNPTCLDKFLPSDLKFPKLRNLFGMISDVSLVHTQLQTNSGFGRVLVNITHLDILVPYGGLDKLPNLLQDCPNLTHLGIESEFLRRDVVERILEGCKKLAVLIVWGTPTEGDMLDPVVRELESQIYAMRRSNHKVVMFCDIRHFSQVAKHEWMESRPGFENHWVNAEALVQSRAREGDTHWDPVDRHEETYVMDTACAQVQRDRVKRATSSKYMGNFCLGVIR